MADEKFNPDDFILMRKTLMDEWLRTAMELNKTVLWLKNERDRLTAENDELNRVAGELNVSGQKLMTMHKELVAENRRLTEALVERMPKIKPDQKGN